MKKQIEEVINWLQQQLKETGAKGFVVGVSGGIDSAVVANLIKRAAPENSLGVLLPIYTKPEHMVDGQKVIEKSGIDSLTLDLTETHEVMYSHIKNQVKEQNAFNETTDQLAGANLRARLRMSALYTVATNYNYLVVGTDNAAEWYTGYFTKYGDGGVDILPLVDFTKSEVREMAKYLDVPETVITKAPSADLWEDQTDEKEMGTTYDKIDAYLKGEQVPEKDKEIIERLHQRSAHKRNALPQFRRNN
ncbi:NAD(+) synthase [Oceanobacillus halophilus]|uniref:NH(3)-dependent NAD(+) synthetase n=1 Tax=Oceanobacillus halophilus TaxID=930130 RepID=A0A495AD57_9BACI|nr:NAD(+) synthase [Oceanobacillus halophilus]RKQ37901.1 NAD(+) synthase [Oceanobacillus halophilus]